MKNQSFFILFSLFSAIHLFSQSIDLRGKITAEVEVDGIHIINKTASRFTVSNADGTFNIPAKLNDTLVFSGISYEPKEVIIDKFIMSSKYLPVYLEELVNVLDEVIVGKVLTGDLQSDIINADLQPQLNFYKLGIPGYTGKRMTQTERRLYQATSGSGLTPIVPIINAISGRTKRLKMQVKLEMLDACLDRMKTKFLKDLFPDDAFSEGRIADFFYYCQEDGDFEKHCKSKDVMATFEFLLSKLKDFKSIVKPEINEKSEKMN